MCVLSKSARTLETKTPIRVAQDKGWLCVAGRKVIAPRKDHDRSRRESVDEILRVELDVRQLCSGESVSDGHERLHITIKRVSESNTRASNEDDGVS